MKAYCVTITVLLFVWMSMAIMFAFQLRQHVDEMREILQQETTRGTHADD